MSSRSIYSDNYRHFGQPYRTTDPQQTFPQFGRLPTELQQMIITEAAKELALVSLGSNRIHMGHPLGYDSTEDRRFPIFTMSSLRAVNRLFDHFVRIAIFSKTIVVFNTLNAFFTLFNDISYHYYPKHQRFRDTWIPRQQPADLALVRHILILVPVDVRTSWPTNETFPATVDFILRNVSYDWGLQFASELRSALTGLRHVDIRLDLRYPRGVDLKGGQIQEICRPLKNCFGGVPEASVFVTRAEERKTLAASFQNWERERDWLSNILQDRSLEVDIGNEEDDLASDHGDSGEPDLAPDLHPSHWRTLGYVNIGSRQSYVNSGSVQ